MYLTSVTCIDGSAIDSAYIWRHYTLCFLSEQILTNVKTEILANMSVKIPLEATSVSAHPAIDSCSMGKHAKVRRA